MIVVKEVKKLKKTTRLININNLKPGQVLSSDIYYYNNSVKLFSEGTVLTAEKIRRLKKFGFISLKIEESVDIKKEAVKTTQDDDLFEISQKKIKEDFNQIYEHANYLVSSAAENRNIKRIITKIDEGVHDHSYKVAMLSTMLGINIENLTEKDLQQLAVAALLHDVGKSTIDFSILNKPGKLTREEYELVKQHSKNGYDILTATELFDSIICDAVLSHHENEDGTGYPNNLKGNEIPLYARIIHICDVYAALTTKRCYKEAWSSEKAISILDEEKKNYEENLLDIFKTSLPIYMKDDVVYLSTGELATVVKTNSESMLLKTFGDNRIIRIDFNNELDDIHIRKKVRA